MIVWIFQDGHLQSFLGFHSTGAIISWMPMFLFVVLFGLSMDYHVFILSRIRESYDRGMPTDEAVSHGIKTTAGVVTSAAVVMVAVFATFATLSLVFFKELGVGLGVAVLIDATLVRAVLLPASMKLLGDWNWYLPSWLEWLPHVGPGGAPALPPEADRPDDRARHWLPSPRANYPAGMSTRSSREPIETVRHQLRPLFDQVVVKELDQDRMRRSGLVVPPAPTSRRRSRGSCWRSGRAGLVGGRRRRHAGSARRPRGFPLLGRRLGRDRRGAPAGLPRRRDPRRARVAGRAELERGQSFRGGALPGADRAVHVAVPIVRGLGARPVDPA